MLIRDSLTPAQVDFVGCAVIAGDWLSVYDGVTWSDPAELEIDHVVALKEAWDSGAWGWTPERRSAFGNDLEDPRSLRAVTGSVNQAKSDKDPSNWIPPDAVVRVHVPVGLGVDQGPMGTVDGPVRVRPHPQPAHRPLPRPDHRPVARHAASRVRRSRRRPSLSFLRRYRRAGNCDPSYPDVCIPPSPPDLDCGDITFRRFTVLPPDPHRFDGDNDGVGCESG